MPGRERLSDEGTTFVNNQIATSVCSSSRSVIYTGQHIQHTRVFDNLGMPRSNELSLEIATIGAYLQVIGYYPAHKKVPAICQREAEIETFDDYGMDDFGSDFGGGGFEF